MKTIYYQQTGVPVASVPVFDAPKWVLGPGDDELMPPELEEFKFPDQITLVGTLKPIWVDEPVTGCYYDDSGGGFSAISLYSDTAAALARIEWVADWLEQTDGAAESLSDPLTWGLDFVVQTKNIIARYNVPSYEHPGFWQQTGSTIEPVWSWGGVYRSGCALADIKQRYFSLVPDGVQSGGLQRGQSHQHNNESDTKGIKTVPQIATKIAWVSSINPHYQMLCDAVECDEHSAAAIFQPMSLLNHIQFGSITYFLPQVVDSIGYQSAHVVDYDPQNGRLKLLFLRRNHGNRIAKS